MEGLERQWTKKFPWLHLAPGKPLQTGETEQPPNTRHRSECHVGWQRQSSSAACLFLGCTRACFPQCHKVSACPAQGPVSSNPQWVFAAWVGLQRPRDVRQCRDSSEQRVIKRLSETEFDHTSFVHWDVKGNHCCLEDVLGVSLWKKFQQTEPLCSAALTSPACSVQGEENSW